jgi:hypothetical protein
VVPGIRPKVRTTNRRRLVSFLDQPVASGERGVISTHDDSLRNISHGYGFPAAPFRDYDLPEPAWHLDAKRPIVIPAARRARTQCGDL